jgi:hypothetical protein
VEKNRIIQFIGTMGWYLGEIKAESLPYSSHQNKFQMNQKLKHWKNGIPSAPCIHGLCIHGVRQLWIENIQKIIVSV